MTVDQKLETFGGMENMNTKEKAAEGTANTLNGSLETTDKLKLTKDTDEHKSHSVLDAALSYAQRGWPVHPLFSIRNGKCTCGNSECSSPGKHPRTEHGFRDATVDRGIIKNWWTKWPEANVSIATGEESGLLLLDVDPRNGGDETLQKLEEIHGSLPQTIEAISGGNGRHVYFRCPQESVIRTSAGQLGAGLDIRGASGSIIAPPSQHVSGGEYAWKEGHEPGKTELAELPDWAITRLQQDRTSSVTELPEGKIWEGQRNETLFHAACCLRGRGLDQKAIEATLQWVNVQQCEPPLEDAEIQSIAASAARYDINLSPETWVHSMNERHGVVMTGGKTFILNMETDPHTGQRDMSLSHKTDFLLRYAHKTIGEGKTVKNIATAWLEHPERREYPDGIVFAPNRHVRRAYNLWQGFAVEPKEGDCSLYLDHIKENIAQGDEMINRYFLFWMAQCVQKPDKRPGVAIVLRGKQGTGKSLFATQFGKLFGKHFVHVQHQKHLLGNFNAHLKEALVVFADEAFWAGDKASEGALKAMVTEEQLPIEYKGKDAFYVQNNIHLLIASNHDWVVPAGPEERRFAVFDMGDKYMQDHGYFEKLVQQMEQGGREALLHFLLNYELTGVNLREFPQTQALMENKLLSMSPVERFWYGTLQRSTITQDAASWETCVIKQHLHQEYLNFARDTGQSRKACETELGMGLKKLVLGIRDKVVSIGGKREPCWIFPDLKTCRDHFNQITKWDHTWPDEEKEADLIDLGETL